MSGYSYFGTAPNNSPYVSPEGIAEQAVTEVDVEAVASAPGWLDGLKSYMETHLVPDANKLTLTDGDSQLWFGGLDSATKVSMLHATYVTAAIQSYHNIAQDLDKASRATAEIIKNYRDVEHNTKVTALNIDTAFADAAKDGGSSGGSAGGSGSDGSADGGSAGRASTGGSADGDRPTGGSW